MNDLLENMDKELEKLRRNEENIKVRKIRALTGDYHEETEEERTKAKNEAVYGYVEGAGNDVIHADQTRVQAFRHKTGQLDSIKSVPYNELEQMRLETAEKLRVLEEAYWGQPQNAEMGKRIAKKYAKDFGVGDDTAADSPSSPEKTDSPKRAKKSRSKSAKRTPKTGILKNKGGESLAKPMFGANRKKSKSKSRKRKEESSPDEVAYNDPRQQIYEAKYEKYLANKKRKQVVDARKEQAKPLDFDLYTKGPGSPSKKKDRFRTHDPVAASYSGKWNAGDLEDDEIEAKAIAEADLKRQQRSSGDPFVDLGVSPQDKMTYFLLKWVFNAIK